MTPFPSRTDDAIAFLDDLALLRADEAADAAYERRERIEDSLVSPAGFDDLLEELTTLNDNAKREFMVCLASADRASCSTLFLELSRAKDRIVDHRLNAGE